MSVLAWGIAPGIQSNRKQALKARFNPGCWLSIPDITLVEIDALFAQQFAVFFLKCASAMVLLLRLYIFQHRLELTRAHRKHAIPALPKKAAIPRINRFDPFRRCFLYVLDQVSLGKSSRQRRDNMNVITNAADAHELGAEVTADRRQISMHGGLTSESKPRLTILSAKDDMHHDFA